MAKENESTPSAAVPAGEHRQKEGAPAPASREERLAAALRANLRRRKAAPPAGA